MTYHQSFDHLGNPVAPTTTQHQADTPMLHKIIQRAGLVVIVVCITLLYGMR